MGIYNTYKTNKAIVYEKCCHRSYLELQSSQIEPVMEEYIEGYFIKYLIL